MNNTSSSLTILLALFETTIPKLELYLFIAFLFAFYFYYQYPLQFELYKIFKTEVLDNSKLFANF